MQNSNDPDGLRLPIKIDSTSNGEFLPRPLARHNRRANALALDWAATNARRLGHTRRNFLTSACGAASTLLALNPAHAAVGKTGGFYDIPAEAALDRQLAAHHIDSGDFIFDIQGHHVSPRGGWRNPASPWKMAFQRMPQASCDYKADDGDLAYLDCFSQQAFV